MCENSGTACVHPPVLDSRDFIRQSLEAIGTKCENPLYTPDQVSIPDDPNSPDYLDWVISQS